jgi:hypothetical protein
MQSEFDPWTRAGGSKDRRQDDYNNAMVKDFAIIIIIGQDCIQSLAGRER